MKKQLCIFLISLLPLMGCATLLGVDPDYLQKQNVTGAYHDKLEEEYGFDRLILMRVLIYDNTKSFNKSSLVTFHFERTEKLGEPSQGNIVFSEGDWVGEEDCNRYEGIVIGQAKVDRLRLDVVTIGQSSGLLVTKIKRLDIAVNRAFNLKKRHLNHLGVIQLNIESMEKAKAQVHVIGEYISYELKGAVDVNTKPLTVGTEEDLETLKKRCPNLHDRFINSVNNVN